MASAEDNGGSEPAFDINAATKEQLMTLPSVGPAVADRIIAVREGHQGRFKNWADLQARVTGLGKKTVAAIERSGLAFVKPLQCFDPRPRSAHRHDCALVLVCRHSALAGRAVPC